MSERPEEPGSERPHGFSRLTKTVLLATVVLAVFVGARVYSYCLNYETFDGLGLLDVAKAFAAGLRFDIAAASMFLAAPFLLMNLPARFALSRRWFHSWAWVACAVACAMALLLVADINFFAYTGRHMSNDLVVLQEKTTVTEMGNHALATTIALLTVAGICLAWRGVLRTPLADAELRPIPFVILAFLLLLGVRGHLSKGRPMSVVDAFRGGSTAQGNLTINGVFSTAKGVFSARGGVKRKLSPEEAMKRVRTLQLGSDPEFPFTSAYDGPALARNLVIVMLESWAPKYLGSFGGEPQGITPCFDALAKKGQLFRRFYAAGIDSVTCVQAALMGFTRHPGMKYLGRGNLALTDFSRFGQLAASRGYRTIFIQPSRPHAWSFGSIAEMLGFQTYFAGPDIPLRRSYPDPKASRSGWDYETLMFALDKIGASGEPFVALVFTGTTHGPFPDPGEKFHLHPHVTRTLGAYLNVLHYADWSLGEFMRAAEETEWYEDTAFLFLGDHTMRSIPDVGLRSSDLRDRYHVPMLLYVPGHTQPEVVDRVCSQLDILPTIVRLLGFSEPYAAVGESLPRSDDSWAFVSDGATIGLIGEDGYVLHDLRRRQETGGACTGAEFDRLERLLLTLDAATYYAVRTNHWLNPRPVQESGSE